jgi:hypothetical protein
LSRNPPKRNAQILLVVTVFCVALIFVPSLVGLDGFEGGFAVSLVSLLLAVGAGAGAFFCFHSAGQLDKILRGEGLLAHWTYNTEQWRRYSQKEYAAENAEKRTLFLVVAAFALLFGVLVWVLDPEAGFYVFLAMLGLIGLIGCTWRFTLWLNHRHNLAGAGEAYVSTDAAYLNGRLYSWRAHLTRFEGAKVENNRGVSVLAIRYIVFTGRSGMQTYTTRVPIPEDKIGEDQEAAQQINNKNK